MIYDPLLIGWVILAGLCILLLPLWLARALFRWRDRAIEKALNTSTTTLTINTGNKIEQVRVLDFPFKTSGV